MGETQYRRLMGAALVLTAAWVGWTVYDSLVVEAHPGDRAYLAGNTYFEDRHYDQALKAYNQAMNENPGHLFALRGRARSLMQLRRDHEALGAFDQAIALAPDFGSSYANRGILRDRMGDYQGAIEDYEKALHLDPGLADGPGWLTRFLRNQPQRPPTIADRARYLRAELIKPDSQRVLRLPEEDSQQRPYKL